WNVQTKLFFEHSTLHGVRYIAENGRPFFEKFMWFACVSIGAVATAVIIYVKKIHIIYHVYKNIWTGSKFLYSLQFFTIYFLLEMNLLDILKDFIRTIKPKTAEIPDLKQTAFELMNRCEEIFENCEWKSYNFSCCDEFFPVFTEKGFCYTFNSRHYEKQTPWSNQKFPEFQMRYIKETDIKWSLKFAVKDTTINMPICHICFKIYILNSDEQAGLDIQAQHMWDYKVDKISFSVKQTYTTEDTKQLSIRQRHCVFAKEIELKTDNIYTYTACTRQCRMDNAMRLCKCVPHFYPQIENYHHCNLKQLKDCIEENLESIKNVNHCSCQLGCSNTVYEAEKLNEVSETTDLEARFVSWPMVRYKREVLFGWVDLLVSFGGIAGLFLGFSLLSGVEILYYFTIRACCMVVREKQELERIQQEEASKPPEDYDLSLIPYCCFDPFPGNGINEVAKGYYNENLYNNKIVPIGKGKWNPPEKILPPFGIEFIN
ncbi:sodium channel protein Nach-like, partial [Asbolus verrucosus]